MCKVYVYVLSRDFGFAPNPFYGYETLATCKPVIRKNADIGDIVIGIGSRTSNYKNKVLFAMKVTMKLTFNEYYSSSRFQCKKPMVFGTRKKQYGDNIYHFENDNWVQDDSHHSYDNGVTNYINLNKDTSSDNVLISEEGSWVYYGTEAIELPASMSYIFDVRRGHRVYKQEFEIIENYFNDKYLGYQGRPIEWARKGGLVRFEGDK